MWPSPGTGYFRVLFFKFLAEHKFKRKAKTDIRIVGPFFLFILKVSVLLVLQFSCSDCLIMSLHKATIKPSTFTLNEHKLKCVTDSSAVCVMYVC